MKKPYKPPVIIDIIEDILTIYASATAIRPLVRIKEIPTRPSRPVKPSVKFRLRPVVRPFFFEKKVFQPEK